MLVLFVSRGSIYERYAMLCYAIVTLWAMRELRSDAFRLNFLAAWIAFCPCLNVHSLAILGAFS